MASARENTHAEAALPAVTGAALRGLHDMAQPLTVLQGSLELALMDVQTVDEYRQWLEFALEQAGRLACNLEYVQQLVRLQQPAGDVGTFSISSLIREMLRELRTSYADSRIEVTVIRRGEHDEICSSHRRLGEALRLIFVSLRSLLRASGKIVLEIGDDALGVFLHFHVAAGRGEPVIPAQGFSTSAGLQLATTIIASAAGAMTLSHDPFLVEVRFPPAKIKTRPRKIKKGDPIHV